MADNLAQKSAVAPGLAVISLILGLFVAGNFPSDPKPGAASPPASDGPDEPGPTPASIALSASRAVVLRPFREALFGEGTTTGAGDPGLVVKKLEGPPKLTVGCLTAMVPDPVETSLSFRFDETLDSIERALGTRDYVLERWRLPWSDPVAPPASGFFTDVRRVVSQLSKSSLRQLSASTKSHPSPGDPGLLVFRKQPGHPGGMKPAGAAPDFILVFLVAETPTQGIDRLALSTGLDLAEGFRGVSASPTADGMAKEIQILGPCFSGSMPSLRDTLLEWLPLPPPLPAKPAFRIRVVSGPASTFAKEEFEGAFVGWKQGVAKVEFSSMVHRTETVRQAIFDFLGSPNGEGFAILSEVNTGFGESLSIGPEEPSVARLKFHKGALGLQYPLHIAEIRERYESQGLFEDGATDVFKAAGELRGRGDSKGKVRDVLPDQTAEATAVAENRVLTQTLRFLEDSRFKAIGIISTDPHDTVFLARLIRRYCPDARVFTVSSDLIFLDPASISDLRGMIVGSTYPLYAPNHAWSGSDESSRGHVFPSEYAQGVFNAAILEVARLTGGDERTGLLEYATPLSLQSEWFPVSGQPPVWISIVGERSLYPVDCRSLRGLEELEKDYLAKALPDPGPAGCGPPSLKINRIAAWMVSFVAISLVLLFFQAKRLSSAVLGGVGPEVRASPTQDFQGSIEALARNSVSILRCLIFAGYLYIACPLLAGVSGVVDLNLDKVPLSWAFLGGVFALFCLVLGSALWAPMAEFASGRRSSASAAAESGGLLLVLAVVIGVISRLSGTAWWLLAMDRATSITGGVSPYVPVVFLMIALCGWIYSRDRIRKINAGLGLASSLGTTADDVRWGPQPDSTAVGEYEDVMLDIRVHRASFESWFGDDREWLPGRVKEFVKRESWKAGWAWLAAIVLLASAWIDAGWFRRLSWSDEGVCFDLVFRFTFVVIFFLFCLTFALLSSAWHDFRAVLAGFAKLLDDAFDRVPEKISNWFFDPAACREEYGLLIVRQIYAIRALLDRSAEPKSLYAIRALLDRSAESKSHAASEIHWDEEETKKHLIALESYQDRRSDSADAEVVSIRYFVRKLAVHWAARPVGKELRPPEEAGRSKDKPSPDEELIARLEELLALHAARWIGGALGRIWTLIGFLVVSSLSLLFAITSYPFPEQPRVMTLLGLGIAALLLMIVRVVLGTNRDEVISRVGDTTPGRISWDSTLLGHFGAFIVPLVGVLAAISFDALDLFRAVLGPILRLFP